MIKVTIQLDSAIHHSRDRILGILTIANDGTGDAKTGNYTFELSKFDGKGVWKKGTIKGFDRIKRGPYDLIYQALRQAVGFRN
jgi:hypothetical protein